MCGAGRRVRGETFQQWEVERLTPAPQSSYGKAAGQETHMGRILASAMRHSVGRPAMGMGGGTLDLWSGFVSRRLNPSVFST